MENTPQLENGYTPIANEILEKLSKINLTAYQYRVLFYIFRKTYGYHKKEDWISISQIVEATGLKQSHVSRTKKELVNKNILYTPTGIKISFQKDWRLWKVNIPNEVYRKNIPNEDKNIPVQGHTKDNIQKIIDTKVSIQSPTEKPTKIKKERDTEVDAILQVFEDVNGTIPVDQKPRQWAYLIKKSLKKYLDANNSTLKPSESLRKFLVNKKEANLPISFNKLQTIYYHLRSTIYKNEKHIGEPTKA